MADALPGALAPSHGADQARPSFSPASHLAHQAGATLTPAELLPVLAGWLASAGYGDAHPWRQAIAATLQAVPGAGAAVAPGGAPQGLHEVLLGIGCQAGAVMGLCQELDAAGTVKHAALIAQAVGLIGWMSDLAVSRFCDVTTAGVNGGEWLLTEHQAILLGLKRGAA